MAIGYQNWQKNTMNSKFDLNFPYTNSKFFVYILIVTLHNRNLLNHLKFFGSTREASRHLHPHLSQLLVVYFGLDSKLLKILNVSVTISPEALNPMQKELINVKEEICFWLLYGRSLCWKHYFHCLRFVMDKLFWQDAEVFGAQLPFMRVMQVVYLLFFPFKGLFSLCVFGF